MKVASNRNFLATKRHFKHIVKPMQINPLKPRGYYIRIPPALTIKIKYKIKGIPVTRRGGP
jgi:hypothetical protein